ncbi:esterase/lipase family protein [Roseibacillus ishigakijimensis]|uniref:Alpha/beta fold hydrolase n=1 Tax=Roseibacillus ishigakijimensis TaxID=454146 RepID=A0A934RV44_9BACT|nr:alpha/beta fold hydrolase [Roseibacillus ishigakijimensis]MBK1835569.1 alpha/beta fold hydrolase [Roseibacillus ishigakijimensis]
MKFFPPVLFALLLSLVLGSCTVPPPPGASTPPRPSTVIVVHGLYAGSGHVRPLQEALTARGFHCLTPNLQPANGSVSIETLARQLGQFVTENTAAEDPLQFVGHSMGGLVSLQLLQDPVWARRCRGLATIATPHQGTVLANLHGGPAGREMTPGSLFLRNLHARPPSFPVTTFRSTRDLVIIPNISSELSNADNRVITAPGHNEILQQTDLHDQLAQLIRSRDQIRP